MYLDPRDPPWIPRDPSTNKKPTFLQKAHVFFEPIFPTSTPTFRVILYFDVIQSPSNTALTPKVKASSDSPCRELSIDKNNFLIYCTVAAKMQKMQNHLNSSIFVL